MQGFINVFEMCYGFSTILYTWTLIKALNTCLFVEWKKKIQRKAILAIKKCVQGKHSHRCLCDEQTEATLIVMAAL